MYEQKSDEKQIVMKRCENNKTLTAVVNLLEVENMNRLRANYLDTVRFFNSSKGKVQKSYSVTESNKLITVNNNRKHVMMKRLAAKFAKRVKHIEATRQDVEDFAEDIADAAELRKGILHVSLFGFEDPKAISRIGQSGQKRHVGTFVFAWNADGNDTTIVVCGHNRIDTLEQPGWKWAQDNHDKDKIDDYLRYKILINIGKIASASRATAITDMEVIGKCFKDRFQRVE